LNELVFCLFKILDAFLPAVKPKLIVTQTPITNPVGSEASKQWLNKRFDIFKRQGGLNNLLVAHPYLPAVKLNHARGYVGKPQPCCC